MITIGLDTVGITVEAPVKPVAPKMVMSYGRDDAEGEEEDAMAEGREGREWDERQHTEERDRERQGQYMHFVSKSTMKRISKIE